MIAVVAICAVVFPFKTVGYGIAWMLAIIYFDVFQICLAGKILMLFGIEIIKSSRHVNF